MREKWTTIKRWSGEKVRLIPDIGREDNNRHVSIAVWTRWLWLQTSDPNKQLVAETETTATHPGETREYVPGREHQRGGKCCRHRGQVCALSQGSRPLLLWSTALCIYQLFNCQKKSKLKDKHISFPAWCSDAKHGLFDRYSCWKRTLFVFSNETGKDDMYILALHLWQIMNLAQCCHCMATPCLLWVALLLLI